MELGCVDLGCISVSDKYSTDTIVDPHNKETDAGENLTSATKTGKCRSPKENGQSTLSALNKCTSQIKKPPHRKNSPLNWFPRKKMDSYLKRKIKMLQEIDGMNLTLDETLGDSNPHYSRVLREKIAAREAAEAAMEARKAALVEASWCKILRAARIPSKEAEEVLLKAEKTAAEAFEAATALGVIMYDKPNCPQKPSEIETSIVNGGRSTTHTVTASFETAFEVDKEVAAAVKAAFIRFASCPSFNKDEFKELLYKISQNPDMGDDNENLSEFSSEYESESEVETIPQHDGFKAQDKSSKLPTMEPRLRKYKRRQSLEDTLLERLRCLKEDELSSLATIVATCGLNAALAETESSNFACRMSTAGCAADHASNFSVSRRMSTAGAGTMAYPNLELTRRKQVEIELPSLDRFLVKHMSKLEREVQEAKNSRRKIEESVENIDHQNNDGTSQEAAPDLGSVLLKHPCKFEKEIEEAKKNSVKSFEIANKKPSETIPDLGSILIKHSSKLEKEVEEIRKNSQGNWGISDRKKEDVLEVPSLDTVLVKHVSRLEKEVQEAKNRRENEAPEKENIDKNITAVGIKEKEDSLDKILVRKVHRLEKEKMEFSLKEEEVKEKKKKKISGRTGDMQEGSLDQILVKHKSRLEKEKMASSEEGGEQIRVSVSRREARERELQEAWGGLSLGNSMKPFISKLERDKAAWMKAEEEERRTAAEHL